MCRGSCGDVLRRVLAGPHQHLRTLRYSLKCTLNHTPGRGESISLRSVGVHDVFGSYQ
jgi:hypothetical protein